MYEFRMPSLGADMEAGTLSRWRIAPGDRVRRGDVVALVETDKSDIEVEIWGSGIVDRLLVAERQRVPVGTLLAVLRDEGEAGVATERAPGEATAPVEAARAPASPIAAIAAIADLPPVASSALAQRAPGLRSSPAARRRAVELGVDLAAIAGSGPGGAIQLADVESLAGTAQAARAAAAPHSRIHPLARRMAEELGLDPRAILGTGIGGAITKADVEAASRASALPAASVAKAPAPAPPAKGAPETESRSPQRKAAAMRQAIAALMARSKREVPHYYLATRIDLSRALAWLTAENLRRPLDQRLLPAALLLKGVALALREVPELNGFWREDAFHAGAGIHLGVAVALRGGGLVAPAIHDVDRLTLAELMVSLRDLVVRARAGTLRGSEMSDPTLTVTNLGDQGVDLVHGVIYPPQVALVGFGRIREQPWAEGGRVDARLAVDATLAADHRASDGHRGGLFLSALERLLQAPETL